VTDVPRGGRAFEGRNKPTNLTKTCDGDSLPPDLFRGLVHISRDEGETSSGEATVGAHEREYSVPYFYGASLHVR